MTDKKAILEALQKLDAANDEHWTASGKPAMKVLEELTGDKGLKRSDVDAAAPDFVRQSAGLGSVTVPLNAEQKARIQAEMEERHPGGHFLPFPNEFGAKHPDRAVKAVSAMDAHLGGSADRFTEDDALSGITDPAQFYADWLKRNRPAQLHKRPYHMLSDIEKARIAVFIAVARG